MANPGDVRAARAYVELVVNDHMLTRGLQKAEFLMRAFASKLSDIGAQTFGMGASMAVPLALAVRQFAELDDTLRLVKAVTSATAKEFQILTDKARQLGKTTSFTSQQVADAMANLGRAGFDPRQIDSMIKHVMNLARATQTNVATAAEITGNAMRQFGMQAKETERIVDVLTATANNSSQTLEDIAVSFKYAAPVAKEFGMAIEETAYYVGILANQGLRGEMAGTSLRNMLARLGGPDVQKQFTEGLEIDLHNASGQVKTLKDLLVEANAEMNKRGWDALQRQEWLHKTFGLRSMAGGAKLTSVGDQYIAMFDAIVHSAGLAAKTAADMDKGIGGVIRITKSVLQELGNTVAEVLVPALKRLGKSLQDMMNRFITWVKYNKQAIMSYAKLSATLTAGGAAFFALGAIIRTLSVLFGALKVAILGAIFGFKGIIYVVKVYNALTLATLARIQGLVRSFMLARGASRAMAAAVGSVAASFAAWLPVIGLVTVALTGLFMLMRRNKKFKIETEFQEKRDNLKQSFAEDRASIKRLEQINSEHEKTSELLDEASNIITDLQRKYGDLGLSVDRVTKSVRGLYDENKKLLDLSERQQQLESIANRKALREVKSNIFNSEKSLSREISDNLYSRKFEFLGKKYGMSTFDVTDFINAEGENVFNNPGWREKLAEYIGGWGNTIDLNSEEGKKLLGKRGGTKLSPGEAFWGYIYNARKPQTFVDEKGRTQLIPVDLGLLDERGEVDRSETDRFYSYQGDEFVAGITSDSFPTEIQKIVEQITEQGIKLNEMRQDQFELEQAEILKNEEKAAEPEEPVDIAREAPTDEHLGTYKNLTTNEMLAEIVNGNLQKLSSPEEAKQWDYRLQAGIEKLQDERVGLEASREASLKHVQEVFGEALNESGGYADTEKTRFGLFGQLGYLGSSKIGENLIGENREKFIEEVDALHDLLVSQAEKGSEAEQSQRARIVARLEEFKPKYLEALTNGTLKSLNLSDFADVAEFEFNTYIKDMVNQLQDEYRRVYNQTMEDYEEGKDERGNAGYRIITKRDAEGKAIEYLNNGEIFNLERRNNELGKLRLERTKAITEEIKQWASLGDLEFSQQKLDKNAEAIKTFQKAREELPKSVREAWENAQRDFTSRRNQQYISSKFGDVLAYTLEEIAEKGRQFNADVDKRVEEARRNGISELEGLPLDQWASMQKSQYDNFMEAERMQAIIEASSENTIKKTQEQIHEDLLEIIRKMDRDFAERRLQAEKSLGINDEYTEKMNAIDEEEKSMKDSAAAAARAAKAAGVDYNGTSPEEGLKEAYTYAELVSNTKRVRVRQEYGFGGWESFTPRPPETPPELIVPAAEEQPAPQQEAAPEQKSEEGYRSIRKEGEDEPIGDWVESNHKIKWEPTNEVRNTPTQEDYKRRNELLKRRGYPGEKIQETRQRLIGISAAEARSDRQARMGQAADNLMEDYLAWRKELGAPLREELAEQREQRKFQDELKETQRLERIRERDAAHEKQKEENAKYWQESGERISALDERIKTMATRSIPYQQRRELYDQIKEQYGEQEAEAYRKWLEDKQPDLASDLKTDREWDFPDDYKRLKNKSRRFRFEGDVPVGDYWDESRQRLERNQERINNMGAVAEEYSNRKELYKDIKEQYGERDAEAYRQWLVDKDAGLAAELKPDRDWDFPDDNYKSKKQSSLKSSSGSGEAKMIGAAKIRERYERRQAEKANQEAWDDWMYRTKTTSYDTYNKDIDRDIAAARERQQYSNRLGDETGVQQEEAYIKGLERDKAENEYYKELDNIGRLEKQRNKDLKDYKNDQKEVERQEKKINRMKKHGYNTDEEEAELKEKRAKRDQSLNRLRQSSGYYNKSANLISAYERANANSMQKTLWDVNQSFQSRGTFSAEEARGMDTVTWIAEWKQQTELLESIDENISAMATGEWI